METKPVDNFSSRTSTSNSTVSCKSVAADSSLCSNSKDRSSSKSNYGKNSHPSSRVGKKHMDDIERDGNVGMVPVRVEKDETVGSTSTLSSLISKDSQGRTAVLHEEVSFATKRRYSEACGDGAISSHGTRVTSSDNEGSGDDAKRDSDLDRKEDVTKDVSFMDHLKKSHKKKSKKNEDIDDDDDNDDDCSQRALATVAGQLARNPSFSVDEARDAAKREYNRLNAARARVRQKDRLQTLEHDYAKLSELTTRLQRENDILKSQLDVLLQTSSSNNKSASSSSSSTTVIPAPALTLSQLATGAAPTDHASGLNQNGAIGSSTTTTRIAEKNTPLTPDIMRFAEQHRAPNAVEKSFSSSPPSLEQTATQKPVVANTNALSVSSSVPSLPAATAVPALSTVASNSAVDNTFFNSILSAATALLLQQQQQQKLQQDQQLQQQQQQQQAGSLSLQNATVLEHILRLSNNNHPQLQQHQQSLQAAAPTTTNPYLPAYVAAASQLSTNNTQQTQHHPQSFSSMNLNNINLMNLMLQQQQQQLGLGATGSSKGSSNNQSSSQVTNYPFFTTG
jgi:hypothetical protein